jgi:branched-chain amino acid transport system permease protein
MKDIKKSGLLNIGIVIALVALVLAVSNLFLVDYYVRIINLIGINIILVASLNLTNGFTGIFSTGHAGFMAVGAYVSALLTMSSVQKNAMLPDLPKWIASLQFPFFAALIVAGLLTSLCALVIGFPVLKLKGHYLTVATLGFLVIIRVLLTNIETFTRGARGISGLPDYTNSWWVYGIAVLTLYILWRVIHSSYGRSMIAIREDHTAAQALGIRLRFNRLLAFCMGAFFAGIGGALWGHLMMVISPNFFSYNQTFLLVEISIIGGMYSLTGAVIGSVVMTIIPEVLRSFEGGINLFGFVTPPLSGLSQILTAVLFIILIIFRPQGIMGYKELHPSRFLSYFSKLGAKFKHPGKGLS